MNVIKWKASCAIVYDKVPCKRIGSHYNESRDSAQKGRVSKGKAKYRQVANWEHSLIKPVDGTLNLIKLCDVLILRNESN